MRPAWEEEIVAVAADNEEGDGCAMCNVRCAMCDDAECAQKGALRTHGKMEVRERCSLFVSNDGDGGDGLAGKPCGPDSL